MGRSGARLTFRLVLLLWDRFRVPGRLTMPRRGRPCPTLPSACCVPLGTSFTSLSPWVATFQNEEFCLDKRFLSVFRVRFSFFNLQKFLRNQRP